jgi:hypothetical protein
MIVGACIGTGGFFRRLLGVLASFAIGGACIGLGYFLTYIGFPIGAEFRGSGLYQVTYTFPIAGWIGMIIGGLISLLGGLIAFLGNGKAHQEEIQMREEIEREDIERLGEERKGHQDS